MSYKNGSIIGVDNTPTTSVASGIWDLNSVRDFEEQGVWPSIVVDATVTPVANVVDDSNLTTYTFSSVSLGTSTANRKIGVVILGGGSTTTVSSVTIDGNSASLATGSKQDQTSGEKAEVWYYDLGAGNTSGDIVVTWGGGQIGCSIAVYDIKGASAGDAHDGGGSTTADPATDTLNIPAGGVAIGGVIHRTSASTFTWTGLTEDYDALLESGVLYQGAASAAFATQQTGLSITADASSAGLRDEVLTLASWGPS